MMRAEGIFKAMDLDYLSDKHVITRIIDDKIVLGAAYFPFHIQGHLIIFIYTLGVAKEF